MHHDHGGVFTWRQDPCRGEQRCLLLGSGVYPVRGRSTYRHPGPAFTRIFHFLRGSAEVVIGRRTLTLDAGLTWLLPSGRSFTVTYADGSLFHYFHLRWLDGLGQDVFASLAEPLGREAGPLAALLCAAHGLDGAARRQDWQPLVLALAARFVPDQTPAGARGERHRDLIAHVLRHAGNGLSVASLARREGISPAALSKRFQRDTGMGLKRWLLLTAMEQARELLATSGLAVQVVAERLGYDDPFHFQRVFKHCVGMTPSAFRRSLLLEEPYGAAPPNPST